MENKLIYNDWLIGHLKDIQHFCIYLVEKNKKTKDYKSHLIFFCLKDET